VRFAGSVHGSATRHALETIESPAAALVAACAAWGKMQAAVATSAVAARA
jgi:hypothetical protein